MTISQHHQGFSAAELLLTLFVVAAFLIVGYQLYITVLDGTSKTQRESSASELALIYLKRYSTKGSIPPICPPGGVDVFPFPRSNPSSSELPDNLPDSTEVQVRYSCPSSPPSNVIQVEATVWYGDLSNDDETVIHSIYATK